MKKIFFLVAMLTAVNSFAQKDNKINLKKGQTITSVTSSSSNTDMGMGMEMKNSNTATNIITVIADEDKNYRITNTIAKMKLSMDMMGQHTDYDSEKAEDKNSDLGKELSDKLNVPDTILIDKKTGTIIKNKKDSPERPEKGDDENPLSGLINSMGGDVEANASVEAVFFIVSSDKKAGDTWTDSSTVNKVTKVKNYTIKSLENNIATILVKTKANGEGVTEMQGNSVSYTMTTTTNGEMTVDVKKGLVNKSTTDMDIAGTIEVMGQSMPISSKGNISIVYQY